MTEEIRLTIRNIAMLILSVGFLGVGMLKLIAFPDAVSAFSRWNLPAWSMYVIGIIEVSLAIAIFYQPWRKNAIYGASILMLAASAVHVISGEMAQLYGPLLVISLLLVLLFTNDPNQGEL